MIIVYSAPDGPPGHEHVAHIFHLEPKPKPHWTAHPVMIFGSTFERAREKAETWWAQQVEAERRRNEPRRATRGRDASAPIQAGIEDEVI